MPRGAGTSLAGGAIPQEDAIVLGVAKMNRVIEVDFANRTARVQSGITNLAISEAVAHEGFFYAPDPSSQLACTIAGNIAMNSGGAHCLKYGVTTNNLLGVTLVILDGTVVEIGGEHLDSPGYDLLGLVTGSEGQLGVVTEAVVRILRAAEGARPALDRLRDRRGGGRLRRRDHRRRHHPGRDGVHGPAGDQDLRGLRACRLSARRRGHAHHRGRGLGRGDRRHAPPHRRDRRAVPAQDLEGVAIGGRERGDLEGPQIRLRRDGAHLRLHLHGRHHPDRAIAARAQAHRRDRRSRYGLGVANVFHAGDGNLHPLVLFDINKPGEMEKAEKAGEEILKLCVEVGGCLTGEHGVGIEKRDLMPYQFNPVDLAQQMRVRGVFDPGWLLNPAKVFPLEGRVAA